MSTTTARRGKRAAKNYARPPNTLFAIAGVAIAVVAVFIAVQTFGGSSDNVPPRVATGDGRVLGDPNAPVTVVEYADFQCAACKRAESSIISRIEQDYVRAGLVKIEFRMFPFLGQESFDAAQAAEAAREQGKFWEYHDALYNAQGRENSGAFSYENLVDLAREVGLDVPAFEATLTSNKYLAPVRREADEARASGVVSTPTFFINDTEIVGARDYPEFQRAIDEALEKAQARQ